MKHARIITVAALCALVAVRLAQAATGEPKEHKTKDKTTASMTQAQDISISGKLDKGSGGMGYEVTLEDGTKVKLPAKAPEGVKYSDLVGASVKVTGKGTDKETGGKRAVHFREVTSVDKQ